MALTKFRPKQNRQSRLTPYKVAANVEIHGGGIMQLVGGYAKPAAAGASGPVPGVAEESVDNRGGAAGAKVVHVRGSVEYEEFLFTNSSVAPVAQADVGSPCYVEDDHTVTSDDDDGDNARAGLVTGVVPEGVWVRFI